MKFKIYTIALALLLPTPVLAMGYSVNYTQCMDGAGLDQNRTSMCMRDELKQQNSRLQSASKILLAQYSERAERQAQKKLQKQWLKMRDQRCDKSQRSESLGQQSRYYNCALKMTVQQANSLEQKTYRYR